VFALGRVHEIGVCSAVRRFLFQHPLLESQRHWRASARRPRVRTQCHCTELSSCQLTRASAQKSCRSSCSQLLVPLVSRKSRSLHSSGLARQILGFTSQPTCGQIQQSTVSAVVLFHQRCGRDQPPRAFHQVGQRVGVDRQEAHENPGVIPIVIVMKRQPDQTVIRISRSLDRLEGRNTLHPDADARAACRGL